MKSFLKIRYPARIPAKAPVLLRVMFERPRSSLVEQTGALKRALRKYPARVYYYGPLLKNQVKGVIDMFRQMRTAQSLAFAYQVIPIAPELPYGTGRRWPFHNFQIWEAYETAPAPTYELSRLALDRYDWRLARR